jgi:UDP-N-acetylmuramoyl-tripeptide--D-alanyl-D-alanine ligase
MQWFKDTFYFLAARYFRFWARISLERWQPRVIVVTGSSGKTTLLHLLEAQFGQEAKVSHHANSAYGVPFDLLGLHGVESGSDWLKNSLLAPIRAFAYKLDQQFYIAEVDAERPGEAPFLAQLLKPEITLWVSSETTHAMFYEKVMAKGNFKTVQQAIAYEYAQVAKSTTGLVVASGDNPNVVESLSNLKAEVRLVQESKDLVKYGFTDDSTQFEIGSGAVYEIPQLQPKGVFCQICMLDEALSYLDRTPDYSFAIYVAPPGRSSFFAGIKNTKIIDSSYNANLSSLKVILEMFAEYPAKTKWMVIGDMLELGSSAKAEHEELAKVIAEVKPANVVLVGALVKKYTLPKLKKLKIKSVAFDTSTAAKKYFADNIKGGEAILFKASQSTHLEVIIKDLLANQKDIEKLPRQSEFWTKRRQSKGLED